MRIKSKIYCFVLLLFLAGCADLVALPFGVADTAVWVATLGNVNMGTSSKVRGTVKDFIDPDRVKRREEQQQAYAREQAAPKQNEEKSQNPDNKQVASSQDKNPVQECMEGCFRIYEKACFREPSERQKIRTYMMMKATSSDPNVNLLTSGFDPREALQERHSGVDEQYRERCINNRDSCVSDCKSLR